MKRLAGTEDTVEIINLPADAEESDAPVIFYDVDKKLTLDLTGVKSEKGKNYSFALILANPGEYKMTLTASSDQGDLAQIPVTVFLMGTASGTFTWNGTGGKPVSFSKTVPMFSRFTAVRLYFAQNGLDLVSFDVELEKPAEDMSIAFVPEE